MCLQLCSKVLSRVQPQPSTSKSHGFSDSTRPRSKTVSFSQRRNSDSSQTLVLEGNVERLKDLSQSDHHLEVDVNQKMEVTSRSASVGARLDSDQPITNKLCDSKKQLECSPEVKSDCQNFTPNLILDECRKRYQELFVVLITSSRMIEWCSHDFNGLFQRLMTESYSEVEKDDTSGLEKLLKACLSSTDPDYDPIKSVLKTKLMPFKFNCWKESGVLDKAAQLEAQSSDWENVFCAACTLLVDLSTFPSFCPPPKPSVSSTTHDLPPWLKLLSVCCCWLGQSPSMQLAAVSTLLDLIAVASKSITSQVTIAENSQVTPVVLTPLLAQDEVQTLENCTCVMQVGTCTTLL